MLAGRDCVRISGIHDGQLYGFDRRSILRCRDPADEEGESPNRVAVPEPIPSRSFERVCRLPATGGLSMTRRLFGGRLGALVRPMVGDLATATVHRLTAADWLVTLGRHVFTSHDGGRTWHRRRSLPPASGPTGVLSTGVCYHDGTLYLGEYPLEGDAPRLLTSTDAGRHWSTAVTLTDARHVHAVQADPFGDHVWVTTGDADDECHIRRLDPTGGDPSLDPVGGGSQTWRAIQLAFTPEAVLWGMDCGYAPTNPLYRLDRDELDAPDPAPTPVGETSNSVYYAAALPVDGEWWVAVTTAVETGSDRTAPTRATTGDNYARVLAASSRSRFTDWVELATFARRSRPADFLPGLPSANAYVYLAGDPAAGLFLNPYNTARANGQVLHFPAPRLAGVADGDPHQR